MSIIRPRLRALLLALGLPLLLLAPSSRADEGVALDGGDLDALHLFFESLERIQEYYVEDLTTEELVKLAIDGIVTGLDEHSRFLEPDAFAAMRSKTRGSFCGIGVVVAVRGGVPTIVSPIDGSPAARAGVRAGDKLVAVDETDTRNATLDTVVELLRGEIGTIARIHVERNGAPLDFVLARAEVALESVIGPIYPAPEVAYVRITRFSETTGHEFARALDEAELEGAAGLVLDLRDNPGGLLSQGVDVAERFVPEGRTIVEVRSRNQLDTRVYRSGLTRKWRKPLVVLVDGGTASAAEIVAGAVRDHQLGALVGETTFGKGSVQSIFAFDAGHALKLTTARYFTPLGASVEPVDAEGGGLAPDVSVAASEGDSIATEIVLSGASTAFIARDAFSERDFSIPLRLETLQSFRAYVDTSYDVDLTGVADDALDRCLRQEMALRDGGQAAFLELQLPEDPQFQTAASIIAAEARVMAAAGDTR